MCDRECDCKTCHYTFGKDAVRCGECYPDSLERCRKGGIINCRGYVPHNPFKRMWWYLTGRLI